MGDEATGTAASGVDAASVERWLAERVPDLRLPLELERIAGGHSNLTYAVGEAGPRRWALRRPPLGERLGSAHDMAREFRVVAALAATGVPVAPLVGLCEDESVIGAPFYVMDFVEGPVLRGEQEAALFPAAEDRVAIAERLVDTLVAIHAVDPDAVGLGDLGRKDEYIARQLRRWRGQWESSKTRELPLVDSVAERLGARIPEQGPATIVHGDYRLDNTILSPAGEIAAVVDWELCTLGDPLADLGLMLVYWGDRERDDLAVGRPASFAPGFPAREFLRDRYAERSGRDLAELDFYLAFGYWKLAVILEGVYARYAAGGYGEVNAGVEYFAHLVERLAEAADAAERRGS